MLVYIYISQLFMEFLSMQDGKISEYLIEFFCLTIANVCKGVIPSYLKIY